MSSHTKQEIIELTWEHLRKGELEEADKLYKEHEAMERKKPLLGRLRLKIKPYLSLDAKGRAEANKILDSIYDLLLKGSAEIIAPESKRRFTVSIVVLGGEELAAYLRVRRSKTKHNYKDWTREIIKFKTWLKEHLLSYRSKAFSVHKVYIKGYLYKTLREPKFNRNDERALIKILEQEKEKFPIPKAKKLHTLT